MSSDPVNVQAPVQRTAGAAAAEAAILAQLSEGIMIADARGKLVFVNQAAKDLHGVEALDVGPEDYAQTYSLFTMEGEPYPSTDLPLARAVMHGETVVDARWRIRRPDGTEVVAIGSARPFGGADGARWGAALNVRDDTARYRAELAMRESERRYRTIFNAIDEGFCVIEFTGAAEGDFSDYVHIEANPAYEANAGMSDIVGKRLREVLPGPEADVWAQTYARVLATGEPVRFERELGLNGRHLELAAFRVEPPSRAQVGVIFQDVTARKRAETELKALNATLEERVAVAVKEREQLGEALRQAQKMEAVGQLTGGIAHDFNNLLTIVTGNIDMLRRLLVEGGDQRMLRYAENALKGAERAAALTQRLLAFSRRQPLAPKPVDVDRLVAGMHDLLARALGETIEIEVVKSARLWTVEVDANQLESALINLSVNARDAIQVGGEGGGKLTIETANVRLDEAYAQRHAEVAPGQYVVIAVSDTGCGMERAVLDRVFEPFFTTKDVDKGTGLGLSMVYGFVKQSGGHIKLYSEAGHGTTVKIYLPRHHGPVIETVEAKEIVPQADASARETVMVVEDDDDVRAYSVELMRELGYVVIEAHDGPSALSLLERRAKPIDLLFTDVVMPGMSGRELADAARLVQPRLKVLYTTGYARNSITHGGRLEPGVDVIAKPFTYEAIGKTLRALLDRGRVRRVLLAEADASLRAVTADLLRELDYAVEVAATAGEVSGRLRASDWALDALILAEDVRPGGVIDYVTELRALRADLPVLVLAEGTDDALAAAMAGDHCAAVIAKPCDGAGLRGGLERLGLECAEAHHPSP